MTQYDVAFIGSGHASWHAAVALKQAGKSVVLIEKDLIAGTCTNYGCDAKILLDGPAELLARVANYQDVGLAADIQLDWPRFMAYKHRVIDALPNQMTNLFTKMGIDIIHGKGILMGSHSIQVGKQRITATNIVLGTGQQSRFLPVMGKEYLHDSRDFLDLPTLPKRMTFIGAGVISFEFAALVSQFGTEVTILQHDARAAKSFNQVHVQKLLTRLAEQGVTVRFNETVKRVKRLTKEDQVITESGLIIPTDYVVDATGREANVTGIGLENAGIHSSAAGIEVDDHLRANGANIYASGDVLAKQVPKLTPTAIFESNYIAQQILGSTAPIAYPAIPQVLFSLPRLAQVGITIDEANAAPDGYQQHTIAFGQLMAYGYQNEPDADLRVVLNNQNQLVGAAVYGMDAPDLINALVMIIDQRLTATDLQRMIFAFPTPIQGVLDTLLPFLVQHDEIPAMATMEA
ncbi:NAD(P)/FAD-dependent oxidoreductase [Levilactobacillus yonginensis]|uniref:dihydrolipoyl dehydrogenase family protein n=1 Tax=Levilactobacillus yonginensis TaxID=1054041 RepID=UPI00345C9F81